MCACIRGQVILQGRCVDQGTVYPLENQQNDVAIEVRPGESCLLPGVICIGGAQCVQV